MAKEDVINPETGVSYITKEQAEAAKAVNAIEGIEAMDSGAVLKAALKKMF